MAAKRRQPQQHSPCPVGLRLCSGQMRIWESTGTLDWQTMRLVTGKRRRPGPNVVVVYYNVLTPEVTKQRHLRVIIQVTFIKIALVWFYYLVYKDVFCTFREDSMWQQNSKVNQVISSLRSQGTYKATSGFIFSLVSLCCSKKRTDKLDSKRKRRSVRHELIKLTQTYTQSFHIY